jgi:hypothetical protein
MSTAQTKSSAIDSPPRSRAFSQIQKSIPVPRGPQWYLVAYRWLVVAAGIYTTWVTWTVWQVRSGAEMRFVPMLPLWKRLPQIDLGWVVVASLLLVLVRPWLGVVAYSAVVAVGILMDLTRIQPPFFIMFLLLATIPNVNAQMLGRAHLIAMWFWAGFHKLLIDFIKPAGLPGFRSDIIPTDLAKHFPPEKYFWSTHTFGVTIGWTVSIFEIGLALMCFFPATRRLVGVVALVMHLSIAVWHCTELANSVLAWNVALAFAGLALIAPWRETTWSSLKQCHPLIRAAFVFMFIYPAAYYVNGVNGYLAHCIYVPNTTGGFFDRAGEPHMEVLFMGYPKTRLPLPPGQDIYERYFDAIKQPGDVMEITDPRPWARSNGMNGRRLTYDGELRNKLPFGHWVRRDAEGVKLSEGDYRDGKETGRWIYWYPDGRKSMEGGFVDGKNDGRWTIWSPDGEETRVEYRDGKLVRATEAK